MLQQQIIEKHGPESRVSRWPTDMKAVSGTDRVLQLVEQKWLLHVLRDICCGLTRFNQLQANLGLSRALLTARLRQLATADLIETTRLPGSASRLHYVPTGRGLALYGIIQQLQEWEND